jgi:hypothetical protein
MEPRSSQTAYTEREKEMAKWFEVEPALIRSLSRVVEQIRATNVTSWSNPLVSQDAPTAPLGHD